MRQAKAEGLERSKSLEFWYRRKYGLTSHDPLFLEATRDEMLADYYAHLYTDDPKAADEIEDEDFDPESVARMIGHEDDWEDVNGE